MGGCGGCYPVNVLIGAIGRCEARAGGDVNLLILLSGVFPAPPASPRIIREPNRTADLLLLYGRRRAHACRRCPRAAAESQRRRPCAHA